MDKVPVKIGEGGRIVIPAEFRKALGVGVGDELLLQLDEGRLLLMTRAQAIVYVQERLAKYTVADRSLSDELIAERKDQAKHE